jgi:hypothetical protein
MVLKIYKNIIQNKRDFFPYQACLNPVDNKVLEVTNTIYLKTG